MPHRSIRRRGLAAAATSILAVLGVASAAQAATSVTVTDDGGNPAALGGPVTIRNMSPTVALAFPAGASGYFNATFAGPGGTSAGSPMSCYIYDTGLNRALDYVGNGTYTVTVQNFAKGDTACRTATSTETFTFTINASVSVAQPAAPFLIRNPDSFVHNTLSLPVQLNPGAVGYDVQYALGAVLNPDGTISGAPQAGYVNSTTGTIDLSLTTPGTYTVIARAHGDAQIGTAWSAPVTVIAQVPFDLSTISFPDSIGPTYSVRGTLNETSIRGTVSLALARRGKHNKYGSYKSVGKVRVSSRGTFTKRFKERTYGTYRLRIHYAGAPTTPARTVYNTFRITKHLFYK